MLAKVHKRSSILLILFSKIILNIKNSSNSNSKSLFDISNRNSSIRCSNILLRDCSIRCEPDLWSFQVILVLSLVLEINTAGGKSNTSDRSNNNNYDNYNYNYNYNDETQFVMHPMPSYFNSDVKLISPRIALVTLKHGVVHGLKRFQS